MTSVGRRSTFTANVLGVTVACVAVLSVNWSPRPAGAFYVAPDCTNSQIALGFGHPVSPATGEHAIILTLTNTSGAACNLHGYPKVAFFSITGRKIPFVFSHSSQYFKTVVPPYLGLQPGAHAFALVAKYRCDVGDGPAAVSMTLTMPKSNGAPLKVTTPTAPGVSVLNYCKGGSKDPGQEIGVSPLVASLREIDL